jgi:hypothetical protein
MQVLEASVYNENENRTTGTMAASLRTRVPSEKPSQKLKRWS